MQCPWEYGSPDDFDFDPRKRGEKIQARVQAEIGVSQPQKSASLVDQKNGAATIEITKRVLKEILNAGKSKHGAWSYKQLRLLGVETPPQKGWPEKLIGTNISRENIEKFVRLKNHHLNRKSNSHD